MPGHRDCLCRHCSVGVQVTAFSTGYSFSGSAWHCTLPTKQVWAAKTHLQLFLLLWFFLFFFFLLLFHSHVSIYLFSFSLSNREKQNQTTHTWKEVIEIAVQQSPELRLLTADICRGLNILGFGRQTHFSNSSVLDYRHALGSAMWAASIRSGTLRGFLQGNRTVWEKSTSKTATFPGIFIYTSISYTKGKPKDHWTALQIWGAVAMQVERPHCLSAESTAWSA